jgi:hypothetical protein
MEQNGLLYHSKTCPQTKLECLSQTYIAALSIIFEQGLTFPLR